MKAIEISIISIVSFFLDRGFGLYEDWGKFPVEVCYNIVKPLNDLMIKKTRSYIWMYEDLSELGDEVLLNKVRQHILEYSDL